MDAIRVRFPVDGLLLSGVLHLPEEERPPVVVGCHGLFAGKDSPKQLALAKELVRRGIAYFRFDHRGCGESQGDPGEVTTFSGRKRDLAAALDHLESRGDFGPGRGLFGSSMGGSVVLSVAASDPVDAVVMNAAPALAGPLLALLRETGEAARLPAAFFEEKDAFELPPGPLNPGPILIFHGREDAVVPVDHARIIFDRVAGQKDLVIFPRGDHSMSDPRDQEVFVARAADWFEDRLRP